jgi:AP-2 complex subunit beta-1
MFGMGGQAADAELRSRQAVGYDRGNGDNISQAVHDADAYFAGVGTRPLPAVVNQGDTFGTDGGRETGYVVNAHAPQSVMQPAQGQGSNGDLLIL